MAFGAERKVGDSNRACQQRRMTMVGCAARGRTHANVQQLLAEPGGALREHADHIVLVKDPIVNDISSTKVRAELAQVRRRHVPCRPCGTAALFTSGIQPSHSHRRWVTLSLAHCWPTVFVCPLHSEYQPFAVCA